jgi:antitoxin HicB
MVRYPVVLEPDDNGTVMVTFPDFPEAQTFGNDSADAIARASDALATIVDGYIRARRPLPPPSDMSGPFAELSALMSIKVELYTAMQNLGITKADLGRRLDWYAPQVDRLLTLTHSSHFEQLDAAVRALGGTLRMHVELPQRPRALVLSRRREGSIAAATTAERPKERSKATHRRRLAKTVSKKK